MSRSTAPPLRVEALLLDMDGVLVDSRATVEAAWSAWADRRGLSRAQVLEHAHGSPSTQVVARFAAPDEVAAEAAWVEEHSLRAEGELALPGAERLLTLPGLPVAVVTSASAQVARVRLARVGLPVPDALVTAEDVQRGKPDPEPFLRGAALLGVAASGCLAVDDTPAGTTSARAAGAHTVGVTTSHQAGQLRAAHHVVRDLDDVLVERDGEAWLVRLR